MTKLIIQIPCFNEAETLPATLDDLPREVAGFDQVEVLVIDDGSTDGTAAVAREHGVDHVLVLPRNTGLANAFAVGLQRALELGADAILNTDGDHQYPGRYVHDLVRPIIDGNADMVIGDRQIETIKHFSPLKKLLQRLGSWVVRWASGTDIPDTTSGFRAFSREAALRLSIYSNYTYTLETIIQAGKRNIAVASIPIETNVVQRRSRLIRSVPVYIAISAATIVRIFLMYEALRIFLVLSLIPLLAGSFLLGRFGYFYLIGQGSGHVQSLVVAAILMVMGFLTILLGLLADLIAQNRRMSEDILYKVRKFTLE
jgi:glycosyltransferase involved in cell wall biosynthesis